jgi:molybdopterin synthase catalytic subunit
MRINVLFFGFAHDLTGFGQEQVDIAPGETVGNLQTRYETRFPRLREVAGSLLAAVNQEVTVRSQVLRDGDEVAFLPPVSGGTEDDFYRITRESIPTQELAWQLKAPEDGAVVIFEGRVRNHSQGRKTLHLEYEAYEPMAVRKLEEIGREAKEKFGVAHIGIIHRVGRLEIGDTSVAIIVTSAHRRTAFEACHYAIDRLKHAVPIWKREVFEDGTIWAEGEGQSSVQQSAAGGRQETGRRACSSCKPTAES